MKKQSVKWLSVSVGLVLGALAFSMAAQAAVPPTAASAHKMSKFPEGERVVYTRLVQAFRANKLQEVLKERALLERNYPLSVHLDNAYYLSGTLEFQNGHYAEALKAYDVVRNKYIKSNKRPSAMFGMAMTYEKLNLLPQARRVFEKIIAEYPGSQESQRAWMSMRIEKEPKKVPTVKR